MKTARSSETFESTTSLHDVTIQKTTWTWCSGLWRPEDGGSMVLRNVGILPHLYTASQSKKTMIWTRILFQG